MPFGTSGVWGWLWGPHQGPASLSCWLLPKTGPLSKGAHAVPQSPPSPQCPPNTVPPAPPQRPLHSVPLSKALTIVVSRGGVGQGRLTEGFYCCLTSHWKMNDENWTPLPSVRKPNDPRPQRLCRRTRPSPRREPRAHVCLARQASRCWDTVTRALWAAWQAAGWHRGISSPGGSKVWGP